MLLYLVRHGKAEQGAGDDASRRLTDGGRKAVQRVAKALAEAGVRVDRVEHSGLVRARQTAEILASAVGGEIAAAADLGSSADVVSVANRLDREGSLMLVGHAPFMPKMASYLLGGRPDAELLHFRTGSVACLSNGEGSWQLEWFLPPKLA
jgi:phosphohistidine phosphatase